MQDLLGEPLAYLVLEAPAGLDAITAFRIEMLPDATLPSAGSGRGKDGFGVLTLFDVKSQGRAVELSKIATDFSPEGSAPNSVLRPKPQIKEGWFVSPRQVERHFAVIEPRVVLRGDALRKLSIRTALTQQRCSHNCNREQRVEC